MATAEFVGSDHVRVELTPTDRESNVFRLNRLMPTGGGIRRHSGLGLIQVASSTTTSRFILDVRCYDDCPWRGILVFIGSSVNTFDVFPKAQYRVRQWETASIFIAGNISAVLRLD